MPSPERRAAGIVVLLAATLCGCGTGAEPVPPEPLPPAAKIRFALDALDDHGLRGPPDGRRSLTYEFCIPATEAHFAEVRAIDPTVSIHLHSRGRIGCGEGEALCLGTTQQPGFRTTLVSLAALPYVREIVETFFE